MRRLTGVVMLRSESVFGIACLVSSLTAFVAGSANAGLQNVTHSDASNPADEFSGGLFLSYEREHGIQTPINTSTQFRKRYFGLVSADSGAFGGARDEVLNSDYTVTFSVVAPNLYRVTVLTERHGCLNTVDDGRDADAQAGTTGVSCTASGGTYLSGSCILADVADVSSTNGADRCFDQSTSGNEYIACGDSDGAAVAHSFRFTWSQNAYTPGCGDFGCVNGGDEAAVRLGGTSDDTSETAADYPGTPPRTQASDGHFVTVTFTDLCGNGIIDSCGANSEQCDLGANNGQPGYCCTTSCTIIPAGGVCRPPQGNCDHPVPEVCDGLSGDASSCGADVFLPVTTECRPLTTGGDCDVAEYCTGSTATCPPDGVQPAGTGCPADFNLCTLDQCDGTSYYCQHPIAPNTVLCRTSAGACDVAEYCDGTNPTCPTDTFLPNTTVCRAAADICDVAENCTGTSAACPFDSFRPSSVVCRSAAGECDREESCPGTGPSCPADLKYGAGRVCRTSTGDCDPQETCPVEANRDDCPPDVILPAGTVCRGEVPGGCDIEEVCDGTSGACPADAVQPNGTVCNAASSGEECDVSEVCDGTSNTCPADAVRPAGTLCRAATGECDVDETCDGSNKDCPADAFVASGTPCGDPSDTVCTDPDTCDGSGTCDPNHAPASTVCRSAASSCDVAETCASGVCPPDVVAPSGTVCRPAAGDCDVVETCDGTSGLCPSDSAAPAGTECRADTGDCDVGEYCDGTSMSCPTDLSEPDGTACDDGNPNTSPDQCQTGVCVAGPFGCPAGPAIGCRQPTVPGAAQVQIKYNAANTSKTKLKFKWKKGQSTDVMDFGNPGLGTTAYAVCLYHGSTLIYEASVPAGPGWTPGTKGPKYKDKAGSEEGVTKLALKAGPDGKAKAFVKADNKGGLMTLTETPPFAAPLQFTAQIINSDNQCWEAQFDDSIVAFSANTEKLLKAKSR